VAGLLASGWALSAHEFFAGCIRHGVEVTAGSQHIDVKLELRFFEDVSEHEREHMDMNGDGTVSRAETGAYLKRLEASLTKSVGLRIDGKPVALLTLYPGEVDLLGNNRVSRVHHLLTLHYFARTPDGVRAESELVIEDRLWPGTSAVVSFQARGTNGCRIEALPTDDVLLRPVGEKESRLFKARLTVLPAQPKPAAAPGRDHKEGAGEPR
jgi:hypothetical protein